MVNFSNWCTRVALVTLLVAAVTVQADPLPLVSSSLGSNMVLQAAPSKARIWGWTAQASQMVTVNLNNGAQIKRTTSGGAAPFFWSVDLDPVAASFTPNVILVTSGSSTPVKMTNVLFGEVFICSGQSNMQMGVAAAFNSTEEIAFAAKYPNIRLYTVGQGTVSPSPLDNFATIEQGWSVASSSSVGNGNWTFFSATCWFFGRTMYDNLQVPIGLVSTNWGGTYVQAWSSPDALSKCKLNSQDSSNFEKRSTGAPAPNPNQPSFLWNAMVVPLLPMRIRAVTWYQAEANVGPTSDIAYVCQFPAMIQDWKAKMNSADFHFYYVQLAPYWTDDHTSLAGMRLAQEAALELPYVGMATAIDLGDPTSTVGVIHPRNKQVVGQRLARAALNMSFGKSVSWLGPNAKSITVSSNNFSITVTFKVQYKLGDSLITVAEPTCPQNPYCAGFEYFDSASKTWFAATGPARVSNPKSSIVFGFNPAHRPTAARYLYADWPLCSVYTTSGLPALPFLLVASA